MNPLDLRPGQRVHIIGIGGVMMSAIARLLQRQGCVVSGSDMQASEYTEGLVAEGVAVSIGHDAGNLPAGVDLVAMSSAIPQDNAELAAARAAGVPVVKRDQVLGWAVNQRSGLACAGTHGKTTTSGLAAVLLTEAGLDPTFLVGSVVRNYGTNARVGAGPWVVVEADEYDRAFLTLRPAIAVVTNIENDHPDIYPDFGEVIDAFRLFLQGVRPDGLALLGADCATAPGLAGECPATVQTYGTAEGADWRVSAIDEAPGGVSFRLHPPAGGPMAVTTRMYGRHNALNATAAIASAVWAGVPLAEAASLAERYEGTRRRFELLADVGGIRVIDDYAHHPTEVAATVAAARKLGGRLRVVYEPHQYARTRSLIDEYARAFAGADDAYVTDIYQVREHDTSGVSSARLAEVAGPPAEYVGTPADARERLTATARAGDVWLIMGAGPITDLAHELADWVTSR